MALLPSHCWNGLPVNGRNCRSVVPGSEATAADLASGRLKIEGQIGCLVSGGCERQADFQGTRLIGDPPKMAQRLLWCSAWLTLVQAPYLPAHPGTTSSPSFITDLTSSKFLPLYSI